MHTVQGGLTGGMVYSAVGDSIEVDKNPAYKLTQVKEGGTEGEHVYDYIPSYANLGKDQSTSVHEKSTNL